MLNHGLEPGEIEADGQLHRCPTQGKPHTQDGAYIIHLDPPASLWWQNWRTGESGTLPLAPGGELSQQDQERIRARYEATKAQREAESARRHAEAARQAQDLYEHSPLCSADHPYLQRKGVPPLGNVRQAEDGALLVPVYDSGGQFLSLQRIWPDGTKRFFPGGKLHGGRFLIPGDDAHPLYLSEGYATGVSVHLATGGSVAVAFSAGNLVPVASSLREQFPPRAIIVCADNDSRGSGTGQAKGREAASAINARLAIPDFQGGEGSDFNDLHQRGGLEAVRRQIMEQAAEPSPGPTRRPALKALEMEDFLSLELPKREYLLYPILPVQGLVMTYAPRGIGKTFVALSIALAVACGGKVFGWEAPKARPVLYLDGEMPTHTMQERLSGLLRGMAPLCPQRGFLRIITPDVQEDAPMPDLATRPGQEAVEPYLSDVSLVVIDNLATLCRTGKENEAQSWQPVQTWLLALRRRGISVLVIHHAGKSGDQRGTSAKEDIMDTVISLRRPEGYEMGEGARFEVHLTKARGIVGEAAKSFEARLEAQGDAMCWTAMEIEDVKEKQLKALLAEGFTVRDAAEEMGMSKSAVQRLKKKMEQNA